MFFSRGSVVYAVEGNRAPVIALHAGRTVLALGATDSDLFVETGLLVTEYTRATGSQVRHWTLTGPARSPRPASTSSAAPCGRGPTGPPTAAVSSTPRSTGSTRRSSAVHVVDKDAFPGDMRADGAGLYFETVHGVTEDLARANPTTSAVQYRRPAVE